MSLDVSECGRGRPVVLVHGSGSDHRTWWAQREDWCERFRLVSYSRRFHWPNEPIEPGGVYALDQHVTDLADLIPSLDLQPATLVGHSYGGLVSLVLAARRPELVDRLILAEPAVLGLFVSIPPNPLQLLRVALRRPRTALGILKLGAGHLDPAARALERGDRDEALRRVGPGILGKDAFSRLNEARRAQVLDNLTLEELRSEEALPRLDPAEIASIRCPTLLVEGARSPRLFSRLLDALQELMPTAERVTIPKASHMVHEDNPAAFNRAVEAFLGGDGPPHDHTFT